jgi:hypothetical protein
MSDTDHSNDTKSLQSDVAAVDTKEEESRLQVYKSDGPERCEQVVRNKAAEHDENRTAEESILAKHEARDREFELVLKSKEEAYSKREKLIKCTGRQWTISVHELADSKRLQCEFTCKNYYYRTNREARKDLARKAVVDSKLEAYQKLNVYLYEEFKYEERMRVLRST